MNYLSLDLGTKRTGVAYADGESLVPVSLPVLEYKDTVQLVKCVRAIVTERNIATLVLGMPYLADGSEGEQCDFVYSLIPSFEEICPNIERIDERFTSKNRKNMPSNKDSRAAIAILETFLEKRQL